MAMKFPEWNIRENARGRWRARRNTGGSNVRIFGPRAVANSREDLLAVLDIIERGALETEVLPAGAAFTPSVARWMDGKPPPFYQGGVLGAQYPVYTEPEEDQIEGERDSPGVD